MNYNENRAFASVWDRPRISRILNFFEILPLSSFFPLTLPSLLFPCTGIPCITDCVIAELESLGPKYRIALRVARDPRFERLPCSHKGTYADDCIVDRITAHKCYCVATCDRDLRRRIRKIPVSSKQKMRLKEGL